MTFMTLLNHQQKVLIKTQYLQFLKHQRLLFAPKLMHNNHIMTAAASTSSSSSTTRSDKKVDNSNFTTLDNITKSSTFTKYLPPDSLLPSPEIAKDAPDQLRRINRILESGFFSWVPPEKREDYKFLTFSPSAVYDLGLHPEEPQNERFQKLVSGQEYFQNPYPYAQAYAGYQFGNWAGQLGDGRVINLFEATNPVTKKKYEIQIKGGGLTPFSRFADGKAVLRSSIREFLGSEAVNALGIPTSRALAITALPKTNARRERIETCAIVTRMAESWVRLGTFDLARRQNRGKDLRLLADYTIDKIYGGENNLVQPYEPIRDDESEQDKATRTSKYVRLYREVVRRNAEMLAKCQLYGFLNGVLNTDNTSVLGLSIDYGPFAFMDTFDRSYTPNHDDGQLRYSYRNIPEAMWWNLIKFAEDLGLLLGGGTYLDASDFLDKEGYLKEEYAESVQEQALAAVKVAEREYREVYKKTLESGFQKRLGLVTLKPEDDEELFKPLLDILEEAGLDFNQTFRKLGDIALFSGDGSEGSKSLDEETLLGDLKEFYPEKRGSFILISFEDSQKKFVDWIKKYRQRLEEEGSNDDNERKIRMNQVNPKFVLKNWILQEVIDRVEKDNDLEVLDNVLHMTLNPFKEEWGRNVVDEMRFTGEVPASLRDGVCSCSS